MWVLEDTRRQMHKNYYTYLNSSLLRAPREYVLHGLVPGLDWASIWPHSMSMHLVATPNPVSCCLLQGFKFHPCFLLSGWLLTNVQVNITTTLHDTCHTCIYVHHTSITINFFFLHIFHVPGQAGCPPLAPYVTVKSLPVPSLHANLVSGSI